MQIAEQHRIPDTIASPPPPHYTGVALVPVSWLAILALGLGLAFLVIGLHSLG